MIEHGKHCGSIKLFTNRVENLVEIYNFIGLQIK